MKNPMRLAEPTKWPSAEGDLEASNSNKIQRRPHFSESGWRWKSLCISELDGMRSENDRTNNNSLIMFGTKA